MRKKRVWLVLVSLCCMFLIGCGNNNKGFKEDNFGLTTSKNESKDGNYVVAINLGEDMGSIEYELSENDKIILSDKYDGEKGFLREHVIQGNVPGEYEYSLKVKDVDGNKLSESITVTVLNDSDTPDNKDDKKETESNSQPPSSEEPWDGEAKAYEKDEKVSFNEKTYKCIQGHTSQEDWTPVNAASLWKEVK